MTDGGTYTLVLALPAPATIEVGALGPHHIPAGGYTYTGSALGSAGFSRVDRHRRVARGDHDVRHWHVDYLTGHPDTTLVTVEQTGGEAVECSVATALARRATEQPIRGFGASDCDCVTHLARFPDVETARSTVEQVYDRHR